MNILSISTDRKIFKEGSSVRSRMIEYGSLFNELHIIVFSSIFHKLKPQKIADNVWIYPTNSLSRWFYIFDALWVGKKIKNINIVTTQDPFEAGLAGHLISKKLNTKLHVQIHTDFINPFFEKDSYLNRLRVKIADFIIPQADGLRVVSERIKKSLFSKYPDLKTFVDVLPVFTPPIPQDHVLKEGDYLHSKYPQFDFIILMASRLEKEKNIELAIQTIKNLPNTTGLVIVGEGGERNKLKRLAKQLGVSKKVVFEGWSNDLSVYYGSADLFLLTSNYEGYGLTLMESALFGCPIVTTNVGLVGGLINKDNAYVCDVGDGECLNKSILTAVNNENLRKALALKAQEEVLKQAMTKKEYLRRYLQSYKNCL